MAGPRRLSDNQLDELATFREEGKSLPWLARHALQAWGVTIHPNSLRWQMLRIGADLPLSRRQAQRIGPEVVKRGNYFVRRFTAEEDRRLLELSEQGLGNEEIARELGRKSNSVRGRMMTLARHDARAEEMA